MKIESTYCILKIRIDNMFGRRRKSPIQISVDMAGAEEVYCEHIYFD